MDVDKALAVIQKEFRKKGDAAKFLCMSPQHYRGLRTGQFRMCEQTKEYIILKAEKLLASHSQQKSPSTSEGQTESTL